jgi:uncharacterized protein YqgC (DUF456 family)
VSDLPRIILGMTYTQATWVFFGFGLLVVEIIALVRGDPPLTDAMRSGAERWMLWPALWGTLCGHFFGSKGGPTWGPFILVGLALLVLYRDFFLRDRVPSATHLEVCLIFVGLGAWLWGSR